MAPPWDRLGTHQRARFRLSKLNGAFERGFKFRSLHVVRESAETRIAPAEVDRAWSRSPEPAEFLDGCVRNSRGAQRFGKRFAIELRIVTRARNRSNVDHSLDSVRFQEFNELFNWACGMSDCEQF